MCVMCVTRQCVNQLRCSLHIDFTIITPHVQVAAGYFVPMSGHMFTDLEMKGADQLLWPQYGV